jgi:pimeloyl-ACP methyl ester carboxylesterase
LTGREIKSIILSPDKGGIAMPNVTANGIQIEYDTFGDPSSPPLLLIMGLGEQMLGWDEDLCKQFASRDLYVIRFDNRDTGLSSKIDEAGVPKVGEVFAALMKGEKANIPYTLDDMADDAIGLLDALNIEKSHLLGVSLGGMIAQIMAIRYPSRVWSLTSMASITGNPEIPMGKPELFIELVNPPPIEREAYIENRVDLVRTISGSKYPIDEQRTRQHFERSYDRGFYPPGIARHGVAGAVNTDRTQALKSVTAPTLVIHGSEDPLFPVEQGKATADAIPGAELLIIDGMGHWFPMELWPLIVKVVTQHIRNTMSAVSQLR